MDESPSFFKTVHVPLTVKVETSQFTHSLCLSAIDRSIEGSRSPRRSNSPDEPDEVPPSDEKLHSIAT